MPVGLGDGSPARSSVNVVQMEKTTSGPSQAIPLSETIENAHTKSAAVVLSRFGVSVLKKLQYQRYVDNDNSADVQFPLSSLRTMRVPATIACSFRFASHRGT